MKKNLTVNDIKRMLFINKEYRPLYSAGPITKNGVKDHVVKLEAQKASYTYRLVHSELQGVWVFKRLTGTAGEVEYLYKGNDLFEAVEALKEALA